MLVYRGFAIQDESKRYLPGPSLAQLRGPAEAGGSHSGRERYCPQIPLPGGKAILAELDREVLDQLFRTKNADISGAAISAADYPAFLQQLDTIRTNGFAANCAGTEEGVSAVGTAIHDAAGIVVGAISVAIPTTRFRKQFDAGLVQESVPDAQPP